MILISIFEVHDISTTMKVATLSILLGSSLGFSPTTPSQRTSSTSLAFFGGQKKSASVKSPLAEDAIEIYLSKYPGNTKAVSFFFESWGMPERYRAPKSTESIFSRKTEELAATFNTLASIYGDEVALKMVKILPSVLAFKKENFQPSLDAFGETFGYDESKEMVIRNPGLLGSKPADAANADNLTMQLSYVVEFTRPIGALGPVCLIGLLSVPAIESALGVSKGELFSAFF